MTGRVLSLGALTGRVAAREFVVLRAISLWDSWGSPGNPSCVSKLGLSIYKSWVTQTLQTHPVLARC